MIRSGGSRHETSRMAPRQLLWRAATCDRNEKMKRMRFFSRSEKSVAASTLSDTKKHQAAEKARERLRDGGYLEIEREAQVEIRNRVLDSVKAA